MKKILITFVVVFSILAVGLSCYMFTKITEDSKVANKVDNLNRSNLNTNKDSINITTNDNTSDLNTDLGNTITNFVNDVLNSVDLSELDDNVTYGNQSYQKGIFNVTSSKLVNTQTISIDDINSISIEYKSFDISFYPSETNELVIMEYMNYTPSENELAQISNSNNSLIIKNGKSDNFGTTIMPGNNKVDIYLPADYSGNLIAVTTSGNISSDLVLNLENITATSFSGNMVFNEITSDYIVLTTTSGNIKVNKAEGVRIFTTTSGNIKIDSGNGSTSASTTSGNITIDNASDSIAAASKSGNINLSIPTNLSFNFKANTKSGYIRTTFDNELAYNKQGNNATGTVGKAPNIDIDIVSNSGNIHIISKLTSSYRY